MIPGRIENATRYLGAPPDWRPDEHGDCVHLAIQDGVLDSGLPAMFSVWEPTPEELERLNSGAKITLMIVGSAHPPCGLA